MSGAAPSAAEKPGVFCRERIILCIDLSREMLSTEFDAAAQEPIGSGGAPTLTRLKVLQDTLATFVMAKLEMCSSHEIAVAVLADDGVRWAQDFSSNALQTLDTIYALKAGGDYRAFDIAELFDLVALRCPELLHAPASHHRVPDRTVRLILTFGRSFTVPTCSNMLLRERLVASRAFFFDVLYLHVKAGVQGAIPQQVYDFFIICSQADPAAAPTSEPKTAYVFECTARASRLQTYVCKLLAHPLQRDFDQDAAVPGT